MKKISFFTYLVFTGLISVLILLIYAAVQQGYRTAANDPQLQIARDISFAMKQNKPPGSFMKYDTVDLNQSLSIFISVYDMNGKMLQSTGLLNGQPPSLPRGVFDYTKQHGEDLISWQPQKGVRIALVVEFVNGVGFVAAGRSLLEVEKREKNLFTMCAIAFGICLSILLAHYIFGRLRTE